MIQVACLKKCLVGTISEDGEKMDTEKDTPTIALLFLWNESANNLTLQHARNGVEHRVGDKKISVDGFCQLVTLLFNCCKLIFVCNN